MVEVGSLRRSGCGEIAAVISGALSVMVINYSVVAMAVVAIRRCSAVSLASAALVVMCTRSHFGS